MFNMKKLYLIDALKVIPGETCDDLLRFVIDLPKHLQDFHRIHHYTGSPSSIYEFFPHTNPYILRLCNNGDVR